MSDVTTEIQIWNASNSENVGGTACDPIPSKEYLVTYHLKYVSPIHVIIIYKFVELFRNCPSQTRFLVFGGESRCPGRISPAPLVMPDMLFLS